MKFIIPTKDIYPAFIKAWQAVFVNRHHLEEELNYDELFFKTHGVRMIRTKMGRGLDFLELEFENEGQFVLFMMEWA